MRVIWENIFVWAFFFIVKIVNSLKIFSVISKNWKSSLILIVSFIERSINLNELFQFSEITSEDDDTHIDTQILPRFPQPLWGQCYQHSMPPTTLVNITQVSSTLTCGEVLMHFGFKSWHPDIMYISIFKPRNIYILEVDFLNFFILKFMYLCSTQIWSNFLKWCISFQTEVEYSLSISQWSKKKYIHILYAYYMKVY